MESIVKTVKLSKIKLNPENPRTITEKAMVNLIKSLQEFPDMMSLREIIVDENNMVLGGNMRLLALQKIGAKEATAKIVKGLTPEQKREFVIKDNAAFGEWDMDVLANAWGDLPLTEWGVDLPEHWLAPEPEEPQDAEPQIDKAAELNKIWKVKTGDLWQIGEHRLLCGDSTKAEDVARVMGGEKARLIFSSPPYSNQREYKTGDFDWLVLANGFSECAFQIIDNPSDVIINLGLQHSEGKVDQYWLPWLDYIEKIGHPLFGWYVWDQGEGYPGDYHGRLARAFEFVFHFSIGHARANKWVKTLYTPEDAIREKEHHKNGPRTGSRQKDGSIKKFSFDKVGQTHKIPDSVIRVGREKARGIHTESHPATFSIGFAEFCIKTWGDQMCFVYDPFLGSGTTMVACQNLNRKCRGLEISPEYCAVILQRMTDAFPDIEIKRMK